MSKKRFNNFMVALAIWTVTFSIAHFIYTTAYIDALEENLVELVSRLGDAK